jgi:peptide/nickel transport system substrate-binding protein
VRRRDLLGGALGAATMSILVACGAPAPSPQQATPMPAGTPISGQVKRGGTIVVAHNGDFLFGGDMFRSTLSNNAGIAGALNGTGNLVKYSRDDINQIAPGVAESWQSDPTFTQWTFKIRNGITWHDGTPFTAQDAQWWLSLAALGARSGDKIRQPAAWSANLGGVDSVEAPDPNTVQLRLKAPKPQLLAILGDPLQQIGHPRHLMQPKIDAGMVDVAPQDVNFVSIGPFKMSRYDKGSRVQLVRHDQYWEKDEQGASLPYLDGIDYAIVPDPSAMDYAFLNSQLDMGARGKDQVLSKDRRDQYVAGLGDRVNYVNVEGTSVALISNTLKSGPLQDARVRQAMALWIDKKAYSPVAGGLSLTKTILSPKSPFTSPDYMTWPGFNPDTRDADRAQARQLLADAGYPNGFSISMLLGNYRQQNGIFFQGQLRDLGIDVQIDLKDAAGETQAYTSRNYELFAGGAPNPIIPELTESLMNVSSVSSGQGSAHNDQKVADLYQQLDAATSMDARVQVWRTLEKYYLIDQAYLIPVDAQIWVVPYRSYVQGLYPSEQAMYQNLDFARISLDK